MMMRIWHSVRGSVWVRVGVAYLVDDALAVRVALGPQGVGHLGFGRIVVSDAPG